MAEEGLFEIRLIGVSEGEYRHSFHMNRANMPDYAPKDWIGLDVSADVLVQKTVGHLDLEIRLKGMVRLACDRCLAAIDLPIRANYDLLVRYAEGFLDDGDIIYVPNDLTNLDLRKSLYELVVLSIPASRRIDCDELDKPPCDIEILNRLNQENSEEKSTLGDFLSKQINLKASD